MPVSALSSSMVAMYRATERFESSATRIAQPDASTDLASEVVNVLGARQDFELATKIARVATDMEKRTIDILA